MYKKIVQPFDYKTKEEFPSKLMDWIGDVFYDILPEHGYEIRDEQIYTAFQLADAVCNKKVHLAEAEVGTGKTFAYLLTAIAYAGFSGKPVVIACASTALQEQLAGPKGDIQTLSRILGLEIDAPMAKDPRQYVCDACSRRGFCKLVKVREHYRSSKDLIIADHSIFFQDLWTRDERIADGKMPMLPDYSLVIFDEGHKVILPAAMGAGRQIHKEDIDNIILSLEEIQGARTSLVAIATALDQASSNFFEKLNQKIIDDEQSERLAVDTDEILLKASYIHLKFK